jgi:hypothetical protein
MQDHWNGYLNALGKMTTPLSSLNETKQPTPSEPKHMSVGWEGLSIFKPNIADTDSSAWIKNKPQTKK